MRERQKKYTNRRLSTLVLIFALLAGILPYSGTSVSKAAETSRSAYGLNNPSTTSDGITTWDCVWFGNYWQNDTNGDGTADKNDKKDPIKWRVLSVNGDDAFLLADTNLDVQKYNDTYTSVTWETCTMRSWLNSAFLNNAFNASEQAAIQNTTVVNEDNPYRGTEGGEDTIDKVYLLSFSEAKNPSYGFAPKTGCTDTRRAVSTAYVAAGGEIKSSEMNDAGYTDYWWLRSPGQGSLFALSLSNRGTMNQSGCVVDDSDYAVRPALHLNLRASSDALSASSWSYAGTVSSDKVLALKLEAKTKALQASWKKVSGAAGYQIWISTSRKFKKKSVKTTEKRKLTVRKLKSGKTYFVKVRVYTVKNGKKAYGAWSETVKEKVKK